MDRPRLDDKIYAPYKLAALVETLAGLGVSPATLLGGTGLGMTELDDARTRTSVSQYITACRNAIRVAPEPITPFLVGRRMRLSAYGMYGYALMSSLTIRDFFDEGVRYHRLATPAVVIEWRQDQGSAIWRFPRPTSAGLEADVHRFLLEQQLMQHVVHLKDVAGPACRPLRATLSYPAPPHAECYGRFLECPVTFGATACELHYDARLLGRPTQLAHKLTSTLMQATCERLIGQATMATGVPGELYQLLVGRPGRFPSLTEAAAELNLHERTLRRRLTQAGTSFGAILDEVRASIAIESLRGTRLKLDDIAALVGFSDATNFRRAFRRWTGKAPGNFRR